MEGDFLENNTIYLKDMYANTIHNLFDSDYVFTSNIGEFNDRFEIVFSYETLALYSPNFDNGILQINALENDRIKFSVTASETIKSIKIYDLLGRIVYTLNGNSHSETYTLSNLNKTVYFVEVELYSGNKFTKKIIKKA